MPYLGLKRVVSFLGWRLYRCPDCGSLYIAYGSGDLKRLAGPGCKTHTEQDLPVAYVPKRPPDAPGGHFDPQKNVNTPASA